MSIRNKIKGLLVGGSIGDALGMPVEGWSPEKILEVHPEGVQRYVAPIGHKWFNPETMPAGSTTDDTQLTIATMAALILTWQSNDDFLDFNNYMDWIAASHVQAMKKSDAGWGNTTREAVRRISNGVNWRVSGKTSESHRGTGNGVVMKCSPLAALLLTGPDFLGIDDLDMDFYLNDELAKFSAMTHYSKMSAEATVAHVRCLMLCLGESEFSRKHIGSCIPDDFLDEISDKIWTDSPWDINHLDDHECQLKDRFSTLKKLHKSGKLQEMTVNELRQEFGNGSCFVYDSLPFSYAFFLRNPFSIQSIVDVVNAGGDTDTNGKLVGELVGALCGIEIFEEIGENFWTMDGLPQHKELIELADLFCDTFKIK